MRRTTPHPPVPEGEPKKRRGFSPGLLTVSVVLHVAFAVVASFSVVQHIALQRKLQFAAAPPVASATKAVEHRVRLQKRSAGGAPAQARRIAVSGMAASIALPEMPAMASTSFIPGRMAGLGGAGAGPGLGFGTGGGMGVGSMAKGGLGLTMFGMRSSGEVVVVIDVSGSNVVGIKSRKSYDELEAEAIKAIRLLTPNAKFNVIAFSSEANAFDKELVSASVSSKESAIRFLKSYSPCRVIPKGDETITREKFYELDREGRHQGTSSKKALTAAFALKPTSIIFVSDGQPTDSSTASILETVQTLQKQLARKAVINTIAYKADSGAIFLQQLAEQNGGNFKIIE